MGREVEPLEQGILANLRYDLPAGLVVFLVALPLCLGITLASGAPLIAGVITGVVAGLIVASLSGSHLSVSGPAAGLTVLVLNGIRDLDDKFEVFLLAVVLSGCFQLVAGALRAGVLASIFPVSVIKGMLAGIGIILVLNQIPHALGRAAEQGGSFDLWMAVDEGRMLAEIQSALATCLPGAALIAAICCAILILWERPFIAARGWAKVLPGSLVAVAAGLATNELLMVVGQPWVVSDPAHLVQLPVIDSFDAFKQIFARPDLSQIGNPLVWRIAVVIAIVGSIESLLSVEATDKLDPFRRLSSPDRELLAQGAGNIVAGLAGGIPLTSVIVRSSTNVISGGRTRWAAFIHGLMLLGFTLAVPSLLNRIPLAALAAVLIVVGYKLANVRLFQKVYRQGADQFIPFIVTVIATVFADLLIGVGAGFLVGVVMVVVTNYTSAVEVVVEGERHTIRFTKDVSFLNKASLRRAFSAVPNGATVLIDGAAALYIDHDVYELVDTFVAGAAHRDISVTCEGLDSKDYPLQLPRLPGASRSPRRAP